MQIFADTADIHEITKWLQRGVLDGVTTNPSIMLRKALQEMQGLWAVGGSKGR